MMMVISGDNCVGSNNGEGLSYVWRLDQILVQSSS